MYAIINDPTTFSAALKLARGSYQRNILRGVESLSGSTLRGKAKRFGGRYQASAQNLIARCRRAGLAVSETRGPHGRRMIVIG